MNPRKPILATAASNSAHIPTAIINTTTAALADTADVAATTAIVTAAEPNGMSATINPAPMVAVTKAAHVRAYRMDMPNGGPDCPRFEASGRGQGISEKRLIHRRVNQIKRHCKKARGRPFCAICGDTCQSGWWPTELQRKARQVFNYVYVYISF
ncbi:unnamed protein product [Protopolystoma xenopodis]|uniref:Uncharacterized protein n=1 Tax=Protopolystoma xenopodis TaxID=117903 RepID=A0A3S5CHI4_9PLAT|nr:unnamed protein product [Protopolystoma xenopodis]